MVHGSGGEARRCKTQGLRQQSTGECEERGSESESKATLSTINDTGRRMTQMLVVVVVVVVVVVLLLLLLRI